MPLFDLFRRASRSTDNSFGSLLEGRQFGITTRRTYNNKELDNETGWQDYGMRTYLVDVPIFASIDPLTPRYPELTPYQFASNSPIENSDLDGLESLSEIKSGQAKQQEMRLKVADMKLVEAKANGQAFSLAKAQALTLEILAKQPQLKKADNSFEAQRKSAEFKRQYAFNKEMAARAAHDPMSYGGPGMGLGLARDPFVQTSASILLTGGVSQFVAINLFQTSTTSLSFSQQFFLKSGIDIAGQALISGPNKIDVFDATIAGLPFKPAFSAFGGGALDIRPFNKGDQISLVGWNKSVTDFTIETSVKYAFGSGGIPGSFKDSYKSSFNLKNPQQLISYDLTNYMISIPLSLTGKGVSKQAKKIANAKP